MIPTILAAATAAQILIGAPLHGLGATRADVEKHLGSPQSVGVDYVKSPYVAGAQDQVVTLSYPRAQVRLYEIPALGESFLLSYVAAKDLFPTHTAIRIGSDHGAVLREIGGPSYEDGDQIVYVDPRRDAPGKIDRVRLVLEKDKVAAYEWHFAVVPPR
jgi:hypothetical protein